MIFLGEKAHIKVLQLSCKIEKKLTVEEFKQYVIKRKRGSGGPVLNRIPNCRRRREAQPTNPLK